MFRLQLANETTYTANALQYTSEFRMAGKWLKLFGLDPGMNSVDTTNMYISCKKDIPTPALTLQVQVHVYDNINIHSSIAKSVYASNSGLNRNYASMTTSVISEVECKFALSHQSASVLEVPEQNGEKRGLWTMLLFH